MSGGTVKVAWALNRLPPLMADPDARYASTITVDLATVSPVIAGPDSPSAVPRSERIVGIDKAFLVGCANARPTDLAAAAQVLRYRCSVLCDARGTAHGVDEIGNLRRRPDFDGPDRQAKFLQLSDGLLRIARVPGQDQVGSERDNSLDIEPECVPDSG